MLTSYTPVLRCSSLWSGIHISSYGLKAGPSRLLAARAMVYPDQRGLKVWCSSPAPTKWRIECHDPRRNEDDRTSRTRRTSTLRRRKCFSPCSMRRLAWLPMTNGNLGARSVGVRSTIPTCCTATIGARTVTPPLQFRPDFAYFAI